MQRKVHLMLDSGAYSVWNLGGELCVREYIDFVKAHRSILDCYVNLDVIPGKSNGEGRGCPREVERAAAAGWANYEAMKSEGLEPVPVFHVGEHIKWLDRMVEDRPALLGLSVGGRMLRRSRARDWLDRIFDRLCDSSGVPVVPIHGFGMSIGELMFRYPWSSVDSTSWVINPAYGHVLIPPMVRGRWCFNSPPMIVVFSDRVRLNVKGVTNYRTMSRPLRKVVDAWLAEQGSDLEQLTDDHLERTRLCCRYSVLLGDHFRPKKFTRHRGLFGGQASNGPRLPTRCRVYLASFPPSNRYDLINEWGVSMRLLSYFHVCNRYPIDLEHYVFSGEVKTRSGYRWSIKK